MEITQVQGCTEKSASQWKIPKNDNHYFPVNSICDLKIVWNKNQQIIN